MPTDNKYRSCLIVDDNDLDNTITIKMIERVKIAENYIVTHSPEDAIKMIRERFISPDLIFVDIDIREKKGFSFIDEIVKSGIGPENTKIFILSSSLNPDYIGWANKNKNITGYVLKTPSETALKRIAEMKK